jgi:hypothetical protein
MALLYDNSMDDGSSENGPRDPSRRRFLRDTAIVGASLATLRVPGVLGVREQNQPGNSEPPAPENTPAALEPSLTPEDLSPLDNYLKEIEPEKKRLLSIIEKNFLFSGFRGLEISQILKDFSVNYPFYEAAKRKYGVPVTLLWIIHGYETTFSRNPNPDVTVLDEDDTPQSTVGAMQRDIHFYSDREVRQAASGWEILDELRQPPNQPGYHKKNGDKTTDYEEILFAAWKMKEDAERIMKRKGTVFMEAVLEAQNNYSADWTAKDRVQRFRTYFPYFQD